MTTRLNTAEAARRLGVSRQHVHVLIKLGELHRVEQWGRLGTTLASIERYAAKTGRTLLP